MMHLSCGDSVTAEGRVGITKIKATDAIAAILEKFGVTVIFGIAGGASLHLLSSVKRNKNLKLVCCHHEQGAVMAADGYARASRKPGVAIATSGPGITNMITGICGAFYDSIPLVVLSGQVSTFRQVGSTGVRQVGFQETPICEILAPITKKTFRVVNASEVPTKVCEAFREALSDRPGPVLIDIPDNLQREMIEFDLNAISPSRILVPSSSIATAKPVAIIEELRNLIAQSERPIIIAGWGIKLSQTEEDLRSLSERTGIPVATTWGASNVIDSRSELAVGNFGTHGLRSANFAVQNADLVISLGARLDTKATGTPIDSFAREAKICMVDIDLLEIQRLQAFGVEIDLPVNMDLRAFFVDIGIHLKQVNKRRLNSWISKLRLWRTEFDEFDSAERDRQSAGLLDPYCIVKCFFDNIPAGSKVFFDTGNVLAWAMQGRSFRPEIEVFHDFNNTAMGWALPATIGSCCSVQGRHFCLVGDGALMMSIQELATLKKQALPITVLIFNNNGYSMIKQTQEQWFEGEYFASGEADLEFPSFELVADSLGLGFARVDHLNDFNKALNASIETPGSNIIEILLPESARVIPQVKFGRPNEDMEPLLDREVFFRQMIVSSISS